MPKAQHLPSTSRVGGKQYRIISTQYPPINVFETHTTPKAMGALWDLIAETNDRLLEEAGDLNLVPEEDRVSGHGATVVMAAYTHIGQKARFNDETFGVYYAGRSQETAIRETVHQREIIAQEASLSATEFSMRVYIGTVKKYLHDVRAPKYKFLHDKKPKPEDHPRAQVFARQLREAKSWGLVYNSVRHEGGECIAAFRLPAVSLPTQGAHLVYVWNGKKMTEVYERSEPIIKF
ncbi:MAG: RES family NAD+ phosphorylase [Gammaproteobacteria bacterium]|nr:RES family NAD+ phosphorylase [Gammaproteobacteria bacterium]